jgi:hypothetical protein
VSINININHHLRGLLIRTAVCILLILSLPVSGCGRSGGAGDDSSAPSQKESAKAKAGAKARQVERELNELQHRDPSSDCKGPAFVNAHATCVFAENAESIYYSEIGIGSGTIGPYEPRVGRDVTIHCTGGSPHKCTADHIAVYFP